MEVQLHHSWPRHYREVRGQLHALAALAPGTHWIGDWVGTNGSLFISIKHKATYKFRWATMFLLHVLQEKTMPQNLIVSCEPWRKVTEPLITKYILVGPPTLKTGIEAMLKAGYTSNGCIHQPPLKIKKRNKMEGGGRRGWAGSSQQAACIIWPIYGGADSIVRNTGTAIRWCPQKPHWDVQFLQTSAFTWTVLHLA
jgi:hypothetical protein